MEQTINLLTPARPRPVKDWERRFDPPVSGRRARADSSTIVLSRQPVVDILMLTAAALLFVNLAVVMANHITDYDSRVISKLLKVFSVDHELNAPAFFSTIILLFSSLLLAIVSYLKYRESDRYLLHWVVLTFGFVFMAFDEMASVHEKLVEPLRVFLGGGNLGIFHFAWVVPGIAVVVFFGCFFLRFLWHLPSRTALMFVFAAALFLSGALGMELVNGSYAERFGEANITYMLLATIEEALEMVGIIVFVKALRYYLAENYRDHRFSFSENVAIRRPAAAVNSAQKWKSPPFASLTRP